jgi:hypothetical protein
MSLEYRFTSGVHAVTGSSPWDTGRTGVTQITIPTTRQGIYDALAAALVAAGFTRFDNFTAGAASSANTNRDDIWFSEGETAPSTSSAGKHIVFRTSLSDAGSAGNRYLGVQIAAGRDDTATALTGTWTWNGTTTVTTTDTSQVIVGSQIQLDSDGQWFTITSITPNTSVVISNPLTLTIPSGATGSSILTPGLTQVIGPGDAMTWITTPFAVNDHRWDLGAADFNSDIQILASLDFVWMVVQNTAHTGTMFTLFVGDYEPVNANANVMVSGGALSAGDFVTITTEDGAGTALDPRVAGYRIGDRVRIVNVDPNGTPRAETQIIVGISATDITVRRLRYSYDGDDDTVSPRVYGARIGMHPQPIMRGMWGNNELELTILNVQLRTPFHQILVDRPSFDATNGDFSAGTTSGDGVDRHLIVYAELDTHAQTNDEFGSGTTGNERTLRFTTRGVGVRSMEIEGAAIPVPGAILGRLPRLMTYNGTVAYYPHDNMLRDRASPQEDFVPFRFTSTSTRNYVLGPTPG